jgi:hypothetical protein
VTNIKKEENVTLQVWLGRVLPIILGFPDALLAKPAPYIYGHLWMVFANRMLFDL